jgi:hypothetical protein
MRHQLQTSFVIPTIPGASLQSMINHLLRHSLSELLRSSDSSVMNEVPADLYLAIDDKKVAPIITELLSTVLSNSKRGRIHLRADRFRDNIILEIQDESNYNGYALENSIHSIEPLARTIGGYISMKGNHQLETTISFSFPDQDVHKGYDC